jgi:hypothetical protein
VVPAAKPPLLATMATLSCSVILMVRGIIKKSYLNGFYRWYDGDM